MRGSSPTSRIAWWMRSTAAALPCSPRSPSSRRGRPARDSSTSRRRPEMAAGATAPLKRASWRQTTWGELLAEFLGIFVLISFGDGVVAMAVAALNQSGRGTQIFAASGDWLIIGWGWGLAVTFGVYVAGGVSGAHINPAVTLAFAARRGFPWSKVPGYIAAQLLGAFAGAALVYAVYKGAIDSYEHANHITRG